MSGERLWSTMTDMFVRAYTLAVYAGSTLPHGSVCGGKLIQSGYFSVGYIVRWIDGIQCVHLLLLSSPPFFCTRSFESDPPSCAREGMSGERLWSTFADMSVRA